MRVQGSDRAEAADLPDAETPASAVRIPTDNPQLT